MFLRLGEVPTLVVSSAEAAELVMRTHDLSFAPRPSSVTIDIVGSCGKGIGFAPYGDRWRQMKKICIMELLNAKQVKRVESIRAEEVGLLLRSIAAASGFVNLSKKASALANDIVAMAMFGGKCAGEKSEFVLAYDQVSELVAGFFPLDFFPSSRIVRRLSTVERRLRGSYGCIQRIIASIVESRNAEIAANGDQEDFLGVLLRLQKQDSLAFPLTPETIGAIMFEVLRLHPPNPMLVPRESREGCEIMGYHIPKGTKIHVNAFAISRDPRYWYNPEAFNPERFENSNVDFKGTNFEFTPFGAGRRQCPAILFGTSAVEIALANLLYHFEWVLPDGENSHLLHMSETFGMGVRKKVELHLRATPYVHSGYV
ncbi:hypothetical protein CFC21_043519 [Triticum aestivum]|uniref:Cytochrome P450 n=2 Tax=Triticum aestivum TaxID=4565 RepID=A0A9R1FND6_WHEAT|nr:hypothetical protein CFC21_043519 [Triticum aestivum]